ncbi:hypothetical protein DCCM_4614 [Desulfocucumis palustris]|uniref:Uncharacterized protein n=1 Tax=Desulfocucumis palustris TaxID=1898651 RepID=A0A2L2XH01_9FIRM|nr:hypothetical protein [Desulfocucumis palustris]GBF35485.1 hypothetical protein DCCM_4614 [Desulfocucumis palustris]
MPDITPRLGLKKPLGNEAVSRAAYNENIDLIDQNAAKASDFAVHLAENMFHGKLYSINDLNGVIGITLPLGLTVDTYASKGICTRAITTNVDVTVLTAIANSIGAFIPVNELGYHKYAFIMRAKTSNAASTTAVLRAVVSAKNAVGNYITLADISFLGTDFNNGTTDYSFLYVPFELKYGLSAGILLLPLDLKFEVTARGSLTNNITISLDIIGLSPAVPASYA